MMEFLIAIFRSRCRISTDDLRYCGTLGNRLLASLHRPSQAELTHSLFVILLYGVLF